MPKPSWTRKPFPFPVFPNYKNNSAATFGPTSFPALNLEPVTKQLPRKSNNLFNYETHSTYSLSKT